MTGGPAGPHRPATTQDVPSRAPVPWWVLPAIVIAAFVGALMARWLDVQGGAPPPTPATAPVAVAPLPTPAAAVAPPATPATPAPATAQAQPVLPPRVVVSGVLMVDGRPSMALVSVDRSASTLVRAGDRLTATATVLAIEPNALIYRDAGVDTRVAVTVQPAGTAIAAAPLPVPAAPSGAAALPATAGEGGENGNAAFRAAIEEKLRSMKR